MAYAFSAVDDLLDPAQQDKQNIFNQGAQAPQQGSQDNGAPSPNVKTTTEGEISGGSQSSTTPAAQKPSQTSFDTTKADQAAYQANAGKTKQPKVFSSIEGQIQQRNQDLQNEANQYVQSQKANQNYALKNQDLEKAIGGDAQTSEATRNLLNRQNIDQVNAFTPKDTSIRDASLLSTDAGLKELIGRGKSPSYTQGMAAFDLQSLRRAPGFDKLVGMIQKEQTDLNKNAQELSSQKQKEVEDFGKSQLDAAQKSVRDYLTGQSGAIDAANEQEAAAYNALLDKYRREGVGAEESSALKAAREAAAANLGQYDKRSAAMIGDVAVDPRQYLNVRENAGRDEFVDQNEAARFNSIMDLLGGADVRAAAGPQQQAFEFDRSALENALVTGSQGLRGAKDVQDKADIDRILKEAQAAADADDLRRSQIDLVKTANEQAALARKGLDPELLKYFNEKDDTLPNAAKYITGDTTDLGANDVLSQAQADQLNALYGDLGLQDKATAGTGLGSAGYNFSKSDYVNALSALLGGKKADAETASVKAEEDKKAADKAAEAKKEQDRLDEVLKINGNPTGIRVGDAEKIKDAYNKTSDYFTDRADALGFASPNQGYMPYTDPITNANIAAFQRLLASSQAKAANSAVKKATAATTTAAKKAAASQEFKTLQDIIKQNPIVNAGNSVVNAGSSAAKKLKKLF
jgi:hypothetical protein